MYCPFCAHPETKVNDSRLAAEGAQIRRRRECLQCGERFTTFETAELVMPLVVKSDERRVLRSWSDNAATHRNNSLVIRESAKTACHWVMAAVCCYAASLAGEAESALREG